MDTKELLMVCARLGCASQDVMVGEMGISRVNLINEFFLIFTTCVRSCLTSCLFAYMCIPKYTHMDIRKIYYLPNQDYFYLHTFHFSSSVASKWCGFYLWGMECYLSSGTHIESCVLHTFLLLCWILVRNLLTCFSNAVGPLGGVGINILFWFNDNEFCVYALIAFSNLYLVSKYIVCRFKRLYCKRS